MKMLYHPDRPHIALAGVLYALGDPVRLEIVRRLACEGELPCAALECDIARSTMSHHFKILRESGVVYTRKEGTQHMNSLRREDLDALFPNLLEAILASARPQSSSAAKSSPSNQFDDVDRKHHQRQTQ